MSAKIITGLVAAMTVAFAAGTHISGRAADKVAILDMNRIIQEYGNSSGEMENLRNQFTTKKRANDALLQQIESMTEELAAWAENSERWVELRKEIEVTKGKYSVEKNANEGTYTLRRGKLLKEIYRKACRVIDVYCEDKKLDIVLLGTDVELVERALSAQEVMNAIIVRTVIHTRDSVDVTDDIIARMK